MLRWSACWASSRHFRRILRAGPTEAVESIYHKRHIAAGIPSMYGSYREERFEAIGLSFRLESLATALLERVIDDGAPTALDRQRLTRIAGLAESCSCARRRLPRPGLGTASRCSTRRSRARGPASTSTSNVFHLAQHRDADPRASSTSTSSRPGG